MTESDLPRAGITLDVYLLPRLPWADVLTLQHRLVYEIAGADRTRAALILCEHEPVITVGRQGSRRHVTLDDDGTFDLPLTLRWTNRGGGCWPQFPGTLAAYPIVPLDPQRPALAEYRDRLYRTIGRVLEAVHLPTQRLPGGGIGSQEGKTLAAIGVAVKNSVAYHGCWLNVALPQDVTQGIQVTPTNYGVTSVFRELRTPIRLESLREQFITQLSEEFQFADTCVMAPPAWLLQPHHTRTA